MTPKYFIGVDVSKLTLDFALLSNNEVLDQARIDNTEMAVKKLLSFFRTKYQCKPSNSFVCAEFTGYCESFLLKACLRKKYRVCLENPLQIKNSLGIQRGKNDALDSVRIAGYASKNHQTLREWLPPRVPVERLKDLQVLRNQLIKIRTGLAINERRQTHFFTDFKREIRKFSKSTVTAVQTDIETIEKEIASIIKKDIQLSRLEKLITSVPGIGIVIATELIICTNEFQYVKSDKSLISYCGIAPFKKESGGKVNVKGRVSGFGNIGLKSLLHMSAINLTGNNKGFLAKYYNRKIKEGKPRMSVLNAVKGKLLSRIVACVRDDKPFVEKKR